MSLFSAEKIHLRKKHPYENPPLRSLILDEEQASRRYADCRDHAAAEQLRRGVLSRLQARDVNGNDEQSTDEGGNPKPEIDQHDDRSDDAAGMPACLETDDLVEKHDPDPAEQIGEIDRKQLGGGSRNERDDRPEQISRKGKDHRKRSLSLAPLVLEMRGEFLERIGKGREKGKEEEPSEKLPYRPKIGGEGSVYDDKKSCRKDRRHRKPSDEF